MNPFCTPYYPPPNPWGIPQNPHLHHCRSPSPVRPSLSPGRAGVPRLFLEEAYNHAAAEMRGRSPIPEYRVSPNHTANPIVTAPPPPVPRCTSPPITRLPFRANYNRTNSTTPPPQRPTMGVLPMPAPGGSQHSQLLAAVAQAQTGTTTTTTNPPSGAYVPLPHTNPPQPVSQNQTSQLHLRPTTGSSPPSRHPSPGRQSLVSTASSQYLSHSMSATYEPPRSHVAPVSIQPVSTQPPQPSTALSPRRSPEPKKTVIIIPSSPGKERPDSSKTGNAIDNAQQTAIGRSTNNMQTTQSPKASDNQSIINMPIIKISPTTSTNLPLQAVVDVETSPSHSSSDSSSTTFSESTRCPQPEKPPPGFETGLVDDLTELSADTQETLGSWHHMFHQVKASVENQLKQDYEKKLQDRVLELEQLYRRRMEQVLRDTQTAAANVLHETQAVAATVRRHTLDGNASPFSAVSSLSTSPSPPPSNTGSYKLPPTHPRRTTPSPTPGQRPKLFALVDNLTDDSDTLSEGEREMSMLQSSRKARTDTSGQRSTVRGTPSPPISCSSSSPAPGLHNQQLKDIVDAVKSTLLKGNVAVSSRISPCRRNSYPQPNDEPIRQVVQEELEKDRALHDEAKMLVDILHSQLNNTTTRPQNMNSTEIGSRQTTTGLHGPPTRQAVSPTPRTDHPNSSPILSSTLCCGGPHNMSAQGTNPTVVSRYQSSNNSTLTYTKFTPTEYSHQTSQAQTTTMYTSSPNYTPPPGSNSISTNTSNLTGPRQSSRGVSSCQKGGTTVPDQTTTTLGGRSSPTPDAFANRSTRNTKMHKTNARPGNSGGTGQARSRSKAYGSARSSSQPPNIRHSSAGKQRPAYTGSGGGGSSRHSLKQPPFYCSSRQSRATNNNN